MPFTLLVFSERQRRHVPVADLDRSAHCPPIAFRERAARRFARRVSGRHICCGVPRRVRLPALAAHAHLPPTGQWADQRAAANRYAVLRSRSHWLESRQTFRPPSPAVAELGPFPDDSTGDGSCGSGSGPAHRCSGHNRENKNIIMCPRSVRTESPSGDGNTVTTMASSSGDDCHQNRPAAAGLSAHHVNARQANHGHPGSCPKLAICCASCQPPSTNASNSSRSRESSIVGSPSYPCLIVNAMNAVQRWCPSAAACRASLDAKLNPCSV